MDLYALLGLAPGASTADIKRAYRRLSRRFHPGINPGDRAAEQMFQRISEAYETLVDPDRRRVYDAAGSQPPEGTTATFEFAGFDFSSAAHGAQAATFTELFADVLNPAAGCRPRHRRAGDPDRRAFRKLRKSVETSAPPRDRPG